MRVVKLSLLCASALATGCASILNGQHQTITVEAEHDEKPVMGAVCTLTNDKGKWYVTTPGSTMINRSFEDLALQCEKAPLEPGLATARSGVKGALFGNAIFGGVIGATIDHASGAAYDYAPLVKVTMGKVTLIEPPPPQAPPVRADCVPGATPMPCMPPPPPRAPLTAAEKRASCVPGNASMECSTLVPGSGSTQTGRN